MMALPDRNQGRSQAGIPKFDRRKRMCIVGIQGVIRTQGSSW